MAIVSFNCSGELIMAIDKTLKEYPDKFTSKSHLIRQLLDKGLFSLKQESKTFSAFIDEVFGFGENVGENNGK